MTLNKSRSVNYSSVMGVATYCECLGEWQLIPSPGGESVLIHDKSVYFGIQSVRIGTNSHRATSFPVCGWPVLNTNSARLLCRQWRVDLLEPNFCDIYSAAKGHRTINIFVQCFRCLYIASKTGGRFLQINVWANIILIKFRSALAP